MVLQKFRGDKIFLCPIGCMTGSKYKVHPPLTPIPGCFGTFLGILGSTCCVGQTPGSALDSTAQISRRSEGVKNLIQIFWSQSTPVQDQVGLSAPSVKGAAINTI